MNIEKQFNTSVADISQWPVDGMTATPQDLPLETDAQHLMVRAPQYHAPV